MITKEKLKEEIDNINVKYFEILYKIILAFETPEIISDNIKNRSWQQFVNDTYGSLAESPIIREPQGSYEIRKEFK